MIIGAMRVKNEARWIERSVASMLLVCDRVVVLDDHSTDGTPRLAAVCPDVRVFDSPFSGLDETRDKNWLLDTVISMGATWVLCIDGDEVLAASGAAHLRELMRSGIQCVSMRIPYLWDSEDQIRVDGVYGQFRRHSAFRPGRNRFTSQGANGFHCGNVPMGDRVHTITRDDIPLLHFGYMNPEDRARKFCWYNAVDPANKTEDHYRHIAAGLNVPHQELCARQVALRHFAGLPPLRPDQFLPPAPDASEKTVHAGPVKLVPWK